MASLNMVTSSNPTTATLINGGARRLKMKRPVNVAEAQTSQFSRTMEGRVLIPYLKLTRWSAKPKEEVLSTITFWVKIDGLTLRNWHEDTLTDIGSDLGIVQAVNLAETKVRVTLGCDKPLVFAMELEYDDEDNHCPLRVVKPEQDIIANCRADWDRNDRRHGQKDCRNRRYGDDRINNQFNRFKGESSQAQEGNVLRQRGTNHFNASFSRSSQLR
ncbi:unnamed protein product [Cochlearia groenlandica]